jgi:hypothetical protein
MDEGRARRLLGEVKEIYGSRRMGGLREWVRNYSGEEQDRQYLERIISTIVGINTQRPSIRILGIDDLIIEEILHYTGFNSPIGEQMAKLRRLEITNELVRQD